MHQLQRIRKAAGLTQAELARRLGVDTRTVRRWETSDDVPQRTRIAYEQLLLSDNTVANSEPLHADSDVPMSIDDVILQQPNMFALDGQFGALLGRLPRERQFSILLGGASGGGKSSAAMMIANLLSSLGPVLYCTSEERIDTGTIGIRATQLGISNTDIDVVEVKTVDDVDAQLMADEYAFCVIDSINELGATPEDVIELMQRHPDTSWILIAQADASEKATVGGARWRHIVDIRLWCEVDKDGSRIVRNLKNRFAPTLHEIHLKSGREVLPTRPKRTQTTTNETPSPTQEDSMPDYYDWMIRRLEADLAQARSEVLELRAKLEARDVAIRELELQVARHEITTDMATANEPKGLSDRFTPETLGNLADKVAPIAMAVGEVLRAIRPTSASTMSSPMAAFMPDAQYAPVAPIGSGLYGTNPFATKEETP